MEQATKGGLVVSQATLDRIPVDTLEELGVTTKRVRKQLFSARIAGVPEDFVMYRVKIRRDLAGGDPEDLAPSGA